MCGIAGIVDFERFPRRHELAPMVEIQRHRGPDGQGLFVDGPVAMGMRRLSIIDLPGGNQPIFNEDGSIAVVFNGEIYNYIELREEMIAKGHQFRTHSDTEVLVHLYEQYGCEMLPLLNGMFDFAIWDAKERRLLMARDRMGVKPLYYAQAGSRWLFGTELKVLGTQSCVDAQLDPEAIADYLRLGYIPFEATPYRHVRRLLPGHFLLINTHGGSVRRWWNLAEWEDGAPVTTAEFEEAIEQVFDDAVKLRMRSDVPVASFLSGGLDSSLVTITAQRHSSIPMHSFTMAFKHTEFDELPYARAVAEHAGTDHRELRSSPRDAIERLPQLIWHMDEPMGDSSIVPNYLISRFAATFVKVCLSGLGGDELFGGYSRYVDAGPGRIRRFFRHAPAAAKRLAPRLESWNYYWAEELRLASDPGREWRAYMKRFEISNPGMLRDLGMPYQGRADEQFEQLWRRYPGKDAISQRQFVDQHTYLPETILALTDRMAMANSLEVRTPFLDYRLVRLSQRINGALKQNARDFKIILKKALGHRCPPEVLNRPKWGFDTPLRRWVAQPDLFEVLQRLPHGLAVEQGWVKRQPVADLVATPQTASVNARRLWILLVLEVWLSIHRRQESPAESLVDVVCAAA
ncbi:MAG TPA: asparagine synthase (glutamine-hydrolyzing) [Bryobacteraceae bacterium]|nr:asparagine synthase (glutamine-hydrolyzing) [Bryobacteraceae bacterium]